MSELGISHDILAAGSDWGTDWIYLLFVLGISVLSWLGNLVKKHREGEAGGGAEDVTDVEPAEFLDDDEPETIRPAGRRSPPPPPAAWPSPASPPLAQPIPQVPTAPRQPNVPPGPAVVLARLKQHLEAKPAPTPTAAVRQASPMARPAPVAIRDREGQTPPADATAPAAGYSTEQLVSGSSLRDRNALRRAIIMAEILDRPVALRSNPPGKWQ